MSQPPTVSSHPPQSPFYGPSPSTRYHGQRCCQLVLISNPAVNQPADLHQIAGYIQQYDPKVTTTIITGRARGLARLLPKLLYPTLAVSFVPLARFRPPRGRFLHGQDLSKSDEYIALEKVGISVPKWQIIQPNEEPNLSDYGAYVVTKPNRGARGALVRIKRKSKVRYQPTTGEKDEHHGRNAAQVRSDAEILAQQFIYTGEWPVNYRVTTLFGKALHSVKSEASHERKKLTGPEDFSECGVSSVVASGRGCETTLNYDEETIQFGEAAALAFPDIPLLGFDIVREVPSGKLYVLEANACGYVWHFSSPMGLSIQQENGFNYESQFDGLRKAAHILADKTQELAR